jgi:hypothetical protein
MAETLAGKYGFPDGPTWPRFANSSAICRSDRTAPVLGFFRASRRAWATTSAGTGLRPSQRPSVARMASLAWRNFATSDAFSNCDNRAEYLPNHFGRWLSGL